MTYKTSNARPDHGALLALVFGAILCVSGCSTPPPAPFVLLAPDIEVEEALTPGSALGPAASQELQAAAAEPSGSPIAVRCRLLYLHTPRTQGLRAPGRGATIVADINGANPVLETPGLTLSTLYTEGAEAQTWLRGLEAAGTTGSLVIADRTTFVPEGAHFQLSMRGGERVEDPRDWLDEFENRGPIQKEAGVIVMNEGSKPKVAIVVSNLDPAHEQQILEDYLADTNVLATAPGPAQDEKVRKEILNLMPSPSLGAPLVLHLDSPFAAGNGTSIAMVVELIDPSEVTGTDELKVAARLAERVESLREKREPLTDETRSAIERSEALSVFQRRGGRSALLQVAQESNATLASEIALVADDSFLSTLSRRAFPVDEGAAALPPSMTRTPMASIGWRLDAAAWGLLAEGALDENLDPELEGVLFRSAGALASFPDLIQEAIGAAKGSSVRFQERLMIEQRYFLEDSAPSSRLRAYDWLKERGVVVPGYDPLGERDARRKALELESEADAIGATDTAPNGPVGEKQ